jgi:hypothetical protein
MKRHLEHAINLEAGHKKGIRLVFLVTKDVPVTEWKRGVRVLSPDGEHSLQHF